VSTKPPVAELIAGLAERVGVPAFVAVCVDLLGGAEREAYVEELRSLTGHAWQRGDAVFDRDVWQDYWVRTWGARGLLHVWDDSATGAVVAGLADAHWRPAEMCLKVTARHDVAGAGDAAALLLGHELPRVRVQALRALAVVGDTQHVETARSLLDDPEEAVRVQAGRALTAMARRLDLRLDR
jgi:hypothetical protein